ncbi:uncharacterized protein LOC113789665 isoform X2 [Dermatophagoides pteronyssinus]
MNCMSKKLDQCLQHIMYVMNNSKLLFPETYPELQLTCQLLEYGDNCTQRYIDQCMPLLIGKMIWNMINDTRNVLQLICHNLTIQNDYLRYASCFKRTATINCMDIVKQIQTLSTSNVNIQQFCCIYKSSVDCQHRSIIKDCHMEHHDNNSARFFLEYSTKISDSLLMQHCLTYTHLNQCLTVDNNQLTITKFKNSSTSKQFDSTIKFIMIIITLIIISYYYNFINIQIRV